MGRGLSGCWAGVSLVVLALSLTASSTFATAVSVQLRWTHQFQFAGYYMALENGYYRDAGLDVTLISGGPNAHSPVRAMLSGQADFAVANSGVVIEYMAGKPVMALASIMQTSPMVWLVLEDSDIFTPQDLIGRRLMMMPPPESAELLAMMRWEGIDVDGLRIIPTSYSVLELINGTAEAFDAYISNEPYFLEQAGFPYRVISPRKYGVNFYSDVLITHQDLATRRPDTVRAFVDATLRGWAYALDNVEETVQHIHEHYAPYRSVSHLRFEADALRELIMPDMVSLGHMSSARWRRIAEEYVALGMAEGTVDLSGFIFRPGASDGRDHTLYLWISVAAIVALILVSLVAARFVWINRRLMREVSRRRAVEAELREKQRQLTDLATTDLLTGVWNRFRFERELEGEVDRSQRYGYPLSLLFMDIDNFKPINDELGHSVGDRVLKDMGNLLSEQLRHSDRLCRWGGEEFLVMAPHTSIADAAMLAEKLRHSVAAADLLDDRTVTISIGVAGLRPGEGQRRLIRRADQCLYQAKAAGRNCIVTEREVE